MDLPQINRLINAVAGKTPCFPPTDIFNETWMLRVCLDWFHENRKTEFPMSPNAGASWYSEALLPSAFLARYRGDNLAESWTHADAVVGHFQIGADAKGDCKIDNCASQFVVCEAKVFSKLSPGVKNAPYYDQAARNVACMAEVLRRGSINPSNLTDLAFYVVAPAEMIGLSVFTSNLTKESIERKVRQRVGEYVSVTHDAWPNDWFLPLLNKITIDSISWENIVKFIGRHDSLGGKAIGAFYENVLKFNRPAGYEV
jgi:hypothetical protein